MLAVGIEEEVRAQDTLKGNIIPKLYSAISETQVRS